jgi:hypothetical protein
MPSPEELADRFVSLTPPGRGSQHIRLEVPGGEAVEIGTYANPGIARVKAAGVRRWVAAVIRVATAAEHPPVPGLASPARRPPIVILTDHGPGDN